VAEERDDSTLATVDTEGRRATRKEQDVLLDVSELEVDKITLEVTGLRACLVRVRFKPFWHSGVPGGAL
jgi:hypothetical protein